MLYSGSLRYSRRRGHHIAVQLLRALLNTMAVISNLVSSLSSLSPLRDERSRLDKHPPDTCP